jgi:hypothetical protein
MGPEDSQEKHDQKHKAQGPADADQKSLVTALVLGNVHRTGNIVRIVICHGKKPLDERAEYSKAWFTGKPPDGDKFRLFAAIQAFLSMILSRPRTSLNASFTQHPQNAPCSKRDNSYGADHSGGG